MSGRSPSAAAGREVPPRCGEPSDADLLSRHLQGDPDALRALFGRHKEKLWAVAIRLLGDVGRAADAIEDAMILAFRNGPEFGGGDAVTTWLCRIVASVCLDRMRVSPPPARDGDVLAALRQLVVDQQSALVLVDMIGYSVADAGDILGISADTLLSRCDRGRARLVAELSRDRRSH